MLGAQLLVGHAEKPVQRSSFLRHLVHLVRLESAFQPIISKPHDSFSRVVVQCVVRLARGNQPGKSCGVKKPSWDRDAISPGGTMQLLWRPLPRHGADASQLIAIPWGFESATSWNGVGPSLLSLGQSRLERTKSPGPEEPTP